MRAAPTKASLETCGGEGAQSILALKPLLVSMGDLRCYRAAPTLEIPFDRMGDSEGCFW